MKVVALISSVVAVTGVSCAFVQSKSEKGSGVLKTQTRTFSNFTQVELRGSVAAIVKVGGKPGATLEFDEILFDHVVTKLEGNKLIIETKGSYSSKRGLKAVITMPRFEAGAITGSGSLVAKGIDAKNCALAIMGSGTMDVSGRTSDLSLSISGSGTMRLADLKAQDAAAAISGSGDIELFASRALTASIDGAGSILYSGSPQVTKRISGSGTVRAR